MEANKVLLQSLYKNIILEFSKKTGKGLEESMDYFYKSETYELISEGVGDLHCKGVIYLTDELMLEYGMLECKSYPKNVIHLDK
jgi:aminoglycoside phosphotransferase family enzyme